MDIPFSKPLLRPRGMRVCIQSLSLILTSYWLTLSHTTTAFELKGKISEKLWLGSVRLS